MCQGRGQGNGASHVNDEGIGNRFPTRAARHSINHMIQTRLPSSGMGPPDLQCCGARGEEENQGMAAQQRAHENLCAPWPDDTCTCGKCAQLCNEEASFDVGLCVQKTGPIGTIHSALACRVGPVVTT